MTRRDDSRKAADAKRRKTQPWRSWYQTPAWRVRREKQRAKTPWCEPCKREGRTRPFFAANHKEPHGGDREKFFQGELESVCENCHNSAIQLEELRGFGVSIGEDGWPVDPAHPFNREPGAPSPRPKRRPRPA